MKTLVFILMIMASVWYLAVGEAPALSAWFAQQAPAQQAPAQQASEYRETLAEQVNDKLSEFKSTVEQQQLEKIESLQTSLVNMAQKQAKLEKKYQQLVQELATNEQAQAPLVELAPERAEPQIVEHEVESVGDGPDVGVVPPPAVYEGETLAPGAHQAVAQAVEIEHQEQAELAQLSQSKLSQSQLMDTRQRRKRLQQLSERMTLRSLGVEK